MVNLLDDREAPPMLAEAATDQPLAALGVARVEPAHLDRLVAAALGVPPERLLRTFDVVAEAVAYSLGSPTTHALARVRGRAQLVGEEAARPRSWSIFVKVLQHVSQWPALHSIPEPFREGLLRIPWRLEIDAHRPAMLAALPAGLRLPRRYDVHEIDETHAALWMEDVDVDPAPWTVARFERAAELLGRLAARRPIGTDAVLGAERLGPSGDLRYYVDGRVRRGVLPALADEQLWGHPLVAHAAAADPTGTLRADLAAAALHIDAWLDLLDTLPNTFAHGDASPQNLLVDRVTGDLVVIDWGFNSPQAVGFDLGQLLVGLAHAGEMDAPEIAPLVDRCVAAYSAGARAEGLGVTAGQVRTGALASLVLRAMFTMLPLEWLGEPDSPRLREQFAVRARMTRLLLDLSAELPH